MTNNDLILMKVNRNWGSLSVVELCLACRCFFRFEKELFTADKHLSLRHNLHFAVMFLCLSPTDSKRCECFRDVKACLLCHLMSWAMSALWHKYVYMRNKDCLFENVAQWLIICIAKLTCYSTVIWVLKVCYFITLPLTLFTSVVPGSSQAERRTKLKQFL